MKTKHLILALAVLTFSGIGGAAAAATYDIDASHSSVNFQIRHLAISKVNGSFDDFSGSFDYVEGEPGSWSAMAEIQTASVNTGNGDRDNHLRSGDFFNSEKNPLMTFKSTGVKGDKMMGDLTLNGITKPVELDLEFNGGATDPWGNEKVSFTATGKIDRKDFGLTWNKALETGGFVVGDQVKITLEIAGAKRK